MKFTQTALVLLIVAMSGFAAADPRFTATARFEPNELKIGENTTLRVAISIPDGYTLYSPTLVSDGPIPLSITLPGAFLANGPLVGDAPEVKWDDGFEKRVEIYHKTATFKRNWRLSRQPDHNPVPIKIRGQICDHKSCFNDEIEVPARLYFKPGTAKPDRIKPTPLVGTVFDQQHQVGEITTNTDHNTNNPQSLGLLAFILMAMAAGFGALLTPCVFPMVPITISFFSKTEKSDRRVSLILAAIYTLSIILVYAIPGVLITMAFGADSMQRIATSTPFNLFILCLLVFFGLNLMGLFELRLPSWLINKSAAKESAIGHRGKTGLMRQIPMVFFMAVTFTLVSFSCTVGFVGGWVLPLAARGEAFYPLVGMIAFSSAFALPFFFLALFPSGAARLQGQAGDWMMAIKMLFGALELAAAFKFLSNLDLSYQWEIITRDVVLVCWCGLFVITSLIILKVLPPNKERAKLGKIRIILAVLLIGAAAHSYSRVNTNRPMGSLVDGWLPPIYYPTTNDAPGKKRLPSGAALTYIRDDLAAARKKAKQERKPLFIDFTGFQCANCRQMESNMMRRPSVTSRLTQMVRAKAFTDGPKPVHRQQRDYQLQRFNTAVLPFYVIIDPFTDTLLGQFSSMTTDEQAFLHFIDNAINQWTPPNIKNTPAFASRGLAPNTSTPAVNFTLPDLFNGSSLSLSQFTGHLVLVNFWASWCAPCKKELESVFPSVLKKYPDLQLLTVAFDGPDTVETARRFIGGLTLPNAHHLMAGEDPESAPLPDVIKSNLEMPTTLIIDPKGNVHWKKFGATDEVELESILSAVKKNN